MKIVRIFAVLAVAFVTTAALAQTNSKIMSATNVIEAKVLYNAFKQGKAEQYKKKMRISGIATYVGPDVYALPSVELSETKDASGRVLCVLPFSDYLKLRKVSKKDRVVMEGNVLGFSDEHDIVVVKQCKIIEVNGKKQ
jgi:hypothetical protein